MKKIFAFILIASGLCAPVKAQDETKEREFLQERILFVEQHSLLALWGKLEEARINYLKKVFDAIKKGENAFWDGLVVRSVLDILIKLDSVTDEERDKLLKHIDEHLSEEGPLFKIDKNLAEIKIDQDKWQVVRNFIQLMYDDLKMIKEKIEETRIEKA